MYSLFKIKPFFNSGIFIDGKQNYLKNLLKKNLGTAISFYRRNPIAVKSEHLLVKLIYSINVPRTQEIERYYQNVDAGCLGITSTLGFSSALYKGQLFSNVFYGPGIKEIIIADDSEIDPFYSYKNWENLEPIKVLRSPITNTNLRVLTGVKTCTEEGLAVISIHIPKLLIQYKAFREMEAYRAGSTGESEKSVMQFLHMYPLANMLRSHLDVVLFNRANAILNNLPMGKSFVKTSFTLINYDKEIDDVLRNLTNLLKTHTKVFTDVLRTLPAVSVTSQLDVMNLPDITPTRYAVIPLVCSRINLLNYLLSINPNARSNNGTEINHIKRLLTEYANDGLINNSILDNELKKQIKAEISQFN